MHSDIIERQKSRLVEMRSRLINSVEGIEQAIRENVRSPGELSNAPTHLGNEDEEGVENHVALAENEAAILEQVEAALGRIEGGTYGHCERCGREIGAERLEALPFTPYCKRCAAANEEEASQDGSAPS